MPYTYTQFDSSLSLAMIEEALLNSAVKSVLTDIAKRLKTAVLSELQNKETSGAMPNLKSLAMQHSTGDKFIGALLPNYSCEQLEKIPECRLLLLSAIDECLMNAHTIHTRHEFLALMKVIDGMAFVYDEFQREKGNPFNAHCKNHLAPSAEEVSIRYCRQGDLLATTYGIGSEIGTDLVPANTTVSGCLSGKALFFILPPEHRRQTWFEKLANQQSMGKPSLPLIAGPSNATAKVFMMSQGLGLFLQNNHVDLDKAQIFANCIMAYLVFSGHHSFFEIVEIWNRQLDFLAIDHPEQLPKGIIPDNPTDKRYIDDADIPERTLPYTIVGNYSSFIHSRYRDAVIARMKSQLDERYALSFVKKVVVD